VSQATRPNRTPARPQAAPAPQGQTFSAGRLGTFTVGADKTVLLGPPFVFTAANINQFNF
jgi:hypothetical protein